MSLSKLTPKEVGVDRVLDVIAATEGRHRVVWTAGRVLKEDGSLHQVMTGDPVRRKSLLRRIRSILKTLASDGLLRERGIQFNFGAGNEAGYDLVGEIGKVGVPIDPECFHLKKVRHTPTASDRDKPPL
ncbi:MAG: hypothetical protein KDN05_04080 [Verrucomicrobiae bacterium]|nr:hypothetical protein [Verrucomicrobiae bacterium]